MPLIVISGRPCSGKTFFANQLAKYLIEKECKVHLVNEESLNITKKDGYISSQQEKELRGALKSAVDHNLSGDKYVIVDSLNYIKGYRYELYCTTRSTRTTHCVVWVGCDEKVSRTLNEKRIAENSDPFEPAVMEDIRRRFEPPNDSNRWDNPLFKVKVFNKTLAGVELYSQDPDVHQVILAENQAAMEAEQNAESEVKTVKKSSWKPKKKVVTTQESQDVESKEADAATSSRTTSSSATTSTSSKPANDRSLYFSGSTISSSENTEEFEEFYLANNKIFDHLSNAAIPVPNSSTVIHKHAHADLLYELDRTSQKILQMIMAHQADNLEGTPIKFLDYDRAMTLHRQVSLAELQRYKGQFVKINAQHPPDTSKEIGASFIDFLAVQL